MKVVEYRELCSCHIHVEFLWIGSLLLNQTLESDKDK